MTTPTPRRIPVTVLSLGKISHKISADEADILVARGQADRVPGLNQIKMRAIRPRGEAREWRKCQSGHAGPQVLQLVPLDKPTRRQSITPAKPHSNAKRRPRLGRSNS